MPGDESPVGSRRVGKRDHSSESDYGGDPRPVYRGQGDNGGKCCPQPPFTDDGQAEPDQRSLSRIGGIYNLVDILSNLQDIGDNILRRLQKPDLRNLLCASHTVGRHAARFLWTDLTFSNFHGYLGLCGIVNILQKLDRTYPYETYVTSFSISYQTFTRSSYNDGIRLDNLLLEIATRCPKLNAVAIDVCSPDRLRWDTVISALTAMKNLQSIQLVSRRLSGEESLAKGLHGAPCQGNVVNDATLVAVAARQGAKIRRIRIAGPAFSDAGVLELASVCTGLREFAALRCTNVTTTSLVHLTRQCRQLSSLSISGCSLISAAFDRMMPYSYYSNLKLLHMDLSGYDGSEGLISLLRNCRTLQEISLAHAAGYQLQALAKHGGHLLGVRLQFPLMTVDAAECFGQFFTSLTVLWISGGTHVLDDHLVRMRAGLTRVESLTLHQLDYITDAGIRGISEYLPKLRWLTLHGVHLTDMCVNALCLTCCRIEQLWLKSDHLSPELYWQCLVRLPHLNWARVEHAAFGTKDAFLGFVKKHHKVGRALRNGLNAQGKVPRKVGVEIDWCWTDDHGVAPML